MSECHIIEAKAFHCGRVARAMRRVHRQSLERLGVDVHRALRTAFDSSYLRRVCMIDGELAALGGVTGSPISPVGVVWVALTEHGARHPLTIVKEARRALDEIAANKLELITTVLDDDETAQRFAVFLGFHVSDEGPGRRSYSKWGRRQLLDFMRRNPDSRMTHGNGFVYRMGYHAEGSP